MKFLSPHQSDYMISIFGRGGSRGEGAGGVHPPPPEMICGFLIQLVFCKKKKKLCGLLVLK